ncbi:Yip1 family protein [Sphingomonas bacterium]|uniref:Yip1 family protein n=1 Tax=Sphingomonas bacterium TaxID=1895847 RepID=UPI00157648C0|nr:Yip1 family protein [Sphingomonas bacterium]
MASQFPGDRPSPITPPPYSPGPDAAGLIARIKGLVTAPAAEWARIEASPMTEQAIYTGVVVPLAAIPAIARAVGSVLFPPHIFGVILRTSVAGAVTGAIVGFLLSILSVFITALIVAALAPQFGGQNNRTAATKLIAFVSAPVWAAGILYIIPQLGGLATLIAGIYAIYLLYLGLPLLMRSAPDKTVAYIIVTVLIAIGVFFVVGIVAGTIVAAVTPTPTLGSITVN